MKIQGNIKLGLDDGVIIDEKFISLLKSIEKTKSLTKSAKELGISYKNLWDNINKIKNKENFIISKKNGGSFITENSKNLIKKFELLSSLQNDFLSKIININFQYMPNFFLKLSARNQIKVKITKIIEGVLHCDVFGTLDSGEELQASITKSSQKELDLKVANEVYFIFKAPKTIILKKDFQNSLMPNLLKAKIISASIGSVNSEISAITSDNQTLVAMIPNDVTMDLRLAVNDEIGVIINPNDIILAT